VTTFPEGLASRLARFGRLEEQEQKVFAARHEISGYSRDVGMRPFLLAAEGAANAAAPWWK
jgi:hypothetical protein